MQGRILSILETRTGPCRVELFGYTTNGIPGIEILLPGQKGKIIKEKFIYFCKTQKIKVPLRRFVLCATSLPELKVVRAQEWQNLELPLFILFGFLAGFLPFQRLDDCLAKGHMKVKGGLFNKEVGVFEQDKNETIKYIGKSPCKEGWPWINLGDLFSQFPQVKIH